ncbi:MAG: hypothetical protein EA340_06795 [Nitriliruptor sp.]|nr:MAG: hypothetical protein EA340_06795 [Nitriliruptor sp.]
MDPTGHRDLDPDVDAVDRSIDEVVAGRLDATDDDAVAVSSVLRRVRTLAATPLPAASRTRHLLTIRTHTPAGERPAPAGGPRRASAGVPRLRRRTAAVVSATLTGLLVLGGGAIAAAQDAPPDAALYGVKRASEQAWVMVPRRSERAAEVQLALAERRIDEARQRPEHAERLVAEGLENVDSAAEELPQEAIDNFARLLGDGPDALPPTAAPAARAALHRNCQRIADRHGLDAGPCGERPQVEHPGRGARPEAGERGRPGGPPGLGEGERPVPRGWGPGGRPEGAEGPPPGVPGWGPGGRPDDAVGPPPGTPGHGRERGSGADE